MGAGGVDLQLSTAAKLVFPFAVEAKCQEALNIWAALSQAEANAGDQATPLLVFARNHSDTYVALKFSDFLRILRDKAV